MSYGSNSGVVRNVIKGFGLIFVNGLTIASGIALISGDVVTGGKGFSYAFVNVTGQSTLPIVGVTVSNAAIWGFCLSVIGAGTRIALWNWLKNLARTMAFKWYHVLAVLFALYVVYFNAKGDMAGLTGIMLPKQAGNIMPSHTNEVTMAAFWLGIGAATMDIVLLDYFFGLDSPFFNNGGKAKLKKVAAGARSIFGGRGTQSKAA